MSKKTRSRRPATARKSPVTGQGTLIDQMMSAIWAAIAAGDPLRAEIEVATAMAVPQVGQLDPDQVEDFSARVLVNDAIERWGAEGTALLRLLMSLGTPRVKRAAGAALEEMTRVGIYPPDWVSQLGKAVPVEARRRYDVFGDDEAVAVTFRYGRAEHGILAQVDLTGAPVAKLVAVSSDPVRLMEAMNRDDDPFDRSEAIGLAEARRRLEGPLARVGEEPSEDTLSLQTLVSLPIARARMRRLPGDAPAVAKVTAADREAAVDEFMTSPLAAGTVEADAEATRFWAEVFTNYNRRTPGARPGQLGPRRLARILLRHVPVAVVLSPDQRRHMAPAVSAWTRWSAESRGLDEAATTRLAEALSEALAGFDEVYDNPGMAAGRAGLAEWDARTKESSAAR